MYVYEIIYDVEYMQSFLANSHSNDVELYDFETSKWKSNSEWDYPFNNYTGWDWLCYNLN